MQMKEKQSVDNIAIYLRISKDDGDTEESESISNQRDIITEYIKDNFNYEKIYEYVDDGVSGTTFNRPGFQKMIRELEKNNIKLVITKNLARFARNYIEAGEYLEKKFPDDNIRYIAILDEVDNFEDKISNEFAPIKGIFNEMFCKETSRNIRKSKRKKMLEGYYSCNVAPYGYKKNTENKGKLIIDKTSSKIVKKIFLLSYKGLKAKEIADILNKEKIKTPSEYLKIKGIEEKSKKIWTRAIITRILSNEVYIGNCMRGKTQKISYKAKKRIYIRREEQIKTENMHEPIISKEIFYKIHNNKFNSHKNISTKNKTNFLRYMYCGKCKSKMTKRRTKDFTNIYCLYRNESDIACTNNTLYKYEIIENLIIKNIEKEFEKLFRNENLDWHLLKKYRELKNKQIDDRLKKINKELAIIKFEISKIYNDRLQENISEEICKKGYDELTHKRKELNEILEDIKKEKRRVDNEQENLKRIEETKEIFKNIDTNTLSERDISELIEKIEIYEDYIHIYYKFPAIFEQYNH